jgi:hypothetical protein
MGRWSQTAGAGAVPWTRRAHMSIARVRGTVPKCDEKRGSHACCCVAPSHRRRRPDGPAPLRFGPSRMKAARGYPRTTCGHRSRTYGREAMELPYSIGADFRQCRARRPPRSSVFRNLDPALAHGIHHSLGSVVNRQLAQDAAHVVLDGLLADRQRVGHLLVGHPLRDVVQDLDLAR